MNLPEERYPNTGSASALLDRVEAAIRNVPGVLGTGATTIVPLRGDSSLQPVITEDNPLADQDSILTPTWIHVTPGFFDAMGVSFVAGRDIEGADNQKALIQGPGTSGVAVVDETFARTFWPDANPVGKRLFLPGVRNALKVRDNTRWLTVVGVVPALKLEKLVGNRSAVGALYTPFGETNANTPMRNFGFVIKTGNAPASVMPDVRQAVARIDPELVLFDIQTVSERASASVQMERLAMILSITFALVALLLSIVGVYGVLSYMIARRRREFGIRIALGSPSSEVVKLVLREALMVIAFGLLIGGVVVIWLRPLIASLLFGMGADDDRVLLTGVAVTLAATGLLACLLPARRATRVDPAIALNDG